MAPISDIQRQTYTDIYRTYSGKLYGICLHYVHDHETACDLLHDSFIVIFSSLDQLRDQSRLVPWMCSIVRNIALKHLRDTSRMPETGLENIPEPKFEDNTANITEIPLDELLKAIDELPEQYGKVFRLSVLDGMSHAEIGEILGIAPHSASSNLARAKKLLRKTISQHWGIILTFCLCIAAILFTVSPERDEMITSDNTVIRIIPAEEAEVMIADLPSVKNLKHRNIKTEVVSPSVPDKQESDTESGLLTADDPETAEATPVVTEQDTRQSYVIEEEEHPTYRKSSGRRISFGISAGAGNPAFGNRSLNTEPPDMSNPPSVPGGSTGNIGSGTTPPGYEGPADPGPDMDNPVPSVGKEYRHSMPMAINLSVKYALTDRWAFSTGVQYTYLHSEVSEGMRKYNQDIHYLGIPVKASWTFWKTAVFNAYGSAGATFEFPIAGRQAGKHMDVPCQLSAGFGIGIQYNISRHIGIYVEPELYRYFDNGSQIQTIRTERPLSINVPVGIRFSW